MTTAHQHRTAVAASQPMALAGIAEHIVTHRLPAAATIELHGSYVGETALPAVNIILDARNVDAWLATIEKRVDSDPVEYLAGTWRDVNGVANSVRVRLSWFTLDARSAPARVLTVVGALVEHEVCGSDDCDLVVCFCSDSDACPGTVIPGCPHLRESWCEEHRMGCRECLADAKAEAGVTGW